MYKKAYGIIETQAPLHVGATAGEETGNLNLIFRDQFTQTGIIPGSSIRGRFRADMRQEKGKVDYWYGKEASPSQSKSDESKDTTENNTTEGIIKFEYASLVWIPVYCPNQPIVRVSCPALLKRYQKVTGQTVTEFKPYSYFGKASGKTLFFNLGFLKLKQEDKDLANCIPKEVDDANKHLLVVVNDKEISMIHDMALYRQSRVSLEPDKKKAKKGAFFDVEALPECTVMVFPIAMRKTYDSKTVDWEEFLTDGKFIDQGKELYFGGLESIGFGRTEVWLKSHNSN
ncbi:MAG TPA: type III-B CRISPR module RAMP protein Cmr4 [Cyanobacteria bacterium UBA11149]|nr:type III-B CRISPR module RAMP protein Cmr4 [Cyanobacteria bacterium UBA11367]HBE59462.1 type III-B CRISPR module RAMP protein Cmr4 [Cyanobacteria bacterium UBA11366]HBK65314.1 type III-B CRISPR module RAMP protein Cmr4 [Cyanobacteria bacterium UBA11166]HBR75190.1 type III-B CRISPR module RAMP protein Cmr4 [Cyanobacteria bacterium UBA11159]HBS68826.1 type III-B CRISPR module RAMP protein Cmr4 [Cyanobacteria bacterium UBA11153]HBW88661.1 type III-B CRISPR module RAMP protein Cmr4 [Cyanobacter